MTQALTPTQLKHIKMAHFYSFDGTWRTAEPSWRVMLVNAENVRGCPSASNTMNDPAQLNFLQRGRRSKAQQPPPQREPGNPEAAAAAATFLQLNFKDQKCSGFANETLCHTDMGDHDPERWGRLGLMTRERLIASDRFGDVALPKRRPVTAPVGLRPATFPKQGRMAGDEVMPKPSGAESSGFTRRPLLHSAKMLTGGFVYEEPLEAPKAVPTEVKVVGNKLPTGFAMNNEDVAAEDATGRGSCVRPADPPTHWARTSIGASGDGENWYAGVGARVTKYGEMQRRKLAPHETGGPVNTLRVETSGFTRNRLHERDHVRQNWVPPGQKEITVERKLQASQLALRMMDNPIEYTTPHAHKMRR